MCLGIPGRIISVDEGELAEVDFGGVRRKTSLSLLPEARVGDFVLVHVGFAIQRLEEKEAREILSLLQEFLEVQEDE